MKLNANFKLLLVVTLMLFCTLSVSALTVYQDGGVGLGDPAVLVQWLSPVIVWLVGMVLKPLLKIPGGLMLAVIVPLLSLAATWIVGKMTDGDTSWLMLFVYNLSAVFIDQLKKKIATQTARTK